MFLAMCAKRLARLSRKQWLLAWGVAVLLLLVGTTIPGSLKAQIEGLPVSATALGFSPDGKRLIAGLADTTAVIYDLTTALRPVR